MIIKLASISSQFPSLVASTVKSAIAKPASPFGSLGAKTILPNANAKLKSMASSMAQSGAK